jgi:hypothetical protein
VGADPRYFVSGCPPIYHGIVDLDIHHLDGAAHAVYLVCIHFASLSFLFLPRHNCRGVYLLPAFREAGLLVSVHLPTLDGGICGLVGSAKEIILKCLRDLRLDRTPKMTADAEILRNCSLLSYTQDASWY